MIDAQALAKQFLSLAMGLVSLHQTLWGIVQTEPPFLGHDLPQLAAVKELKSRCCDVAAHPKRGRGRAQHQRQGRRDAEQAAEHGGIVPAKKPPRPIPAAPPRRDAKGFPAFA